MKTVAVYCGSSPGNDPEFTAQTKRMGQAIVEAGLSLVYGGGNSGLMGVLGNAVMDAGGHVTGIMIQRLVDREKAHRGLSELMIVDDMQQRKKMMASRADACIALPGGIGTLEELFEVFTWSQLGIHEKPCALLNINGFYDPLIPFLDSLVDKAFMKAVHRQILIHDTDPANLLQRLKDFEFPSGVIK